MQKNMKNPSTSGSVMSYLDLFKYSLGQNGGHDSSHIMT